MGLVTISITGKTISIDLTDKGSVLAGSLSQLSEFQQLTTRSDLLSRHLDMGATKLMNFIYQTFPELHKMELNDEIDARGLLNEA
jgi:hypothetical protein